MKSQLVRSFLLSPLLLGCFTSKTSSDARQVNFAKNNSALIKEMAEYSILFCRENKIRTFETTSVVNQQIRKKMEWLGTTVTVTYESGSDHIIDSAIIFKSTTIPHGVKEFIYDFAVNPRNEGTDTSNSKAGILIQISDRVYYRRRPFPMM